MKVLASTLLFLICAPVFVAAQAPPPPPPPPPAPEEGIRLRIERRAEGPDQNLQAPLPPMVQAAPDPNAPKAVLRGRVYAQDTGAPVKRAQLNLRGSRRPGEPLTVITDAQGAFEFKNVESGSYTLSCTRSGFVPATYGQKAPNQPAVPLTVRPGEELKDLDFRLIRGGAITGTVVDEEGEPLPYVQVQVLMRQYVRGQPHLMTRGSASTDDRGQFRIFNLPPGRYYVQASMRGFGDQGTNYVPLLYPNVLSQQDAQRVEVTKGADAQRVDFRMRQVPTFTVSGKVVDQLTGQPRSDVAVSAMRADFQTQGFDLRGVRPDGSFRLTGLMPGRYRLMVTSMGRGISMDGRAVMKTFELGEANIENMVVTVGPGVTLRGKLVPEGGTLGTDNLRVSLTPRGEGFTAGPFMGGNATVNKDFTFEIANVQPGEYDLAVRQSSSPLSVLAGSGAPAAPFYVREVRVGSENVLDRGITVPEGAAPGELEVVLDFGGGSVSGRVLNEAGEPVSGVQVGLVHADKQKRSLDRFFRSGAVDQNGQYSVRGVIPGDYLLVAWPESDVARILDADLFIQLEKHAVSVTVEKSAASNKDLKLTSDLRTIAQNFAQ